ncbi:MAG TPA: methyltransferase domain-containing protein [Stellaceae bacterium]|nr:methyltransferase domain-containing protein [Stellaceae bacterium]
MYLEIHEAFSSLPEWNAWAETVPEIRTPDYLEDVARNICATGFVDPCAGLVPADEVDGGSRNYREGLVARACTSRYRALLTLLRDHVLANGWCSPIYLAEHATDFGDMLASRFPFVVTSEYMPNPVVRMRMAHIRHEDPLRLTFPDRCFDAYLSSDAIVYAASMETVLREARRVLRRGGLFAATFPFRYGEPDTEVLSEIVKGELVHHGAPAFHEDPLTRTRSRLLYYVPGWDIVDAAREAGFASAEIVAQSSRTHAILGSEIAVVFALRAIA